MVGLILCSGRGTRLKEEVKDRPKCMVDVAGKPVLEYIVDHMNKHGIWRIVVNLHLFPEVVMKHFGQRFLYLYEPVPMGEFATVSLVRSLFPGESVVCANGDTITDLDLSGVIVYGESRRFISKETKRHIGVTYFDMGFPIDQLVDCEYFDIGTLSGLAAARKHYEH